MKALIFQKGRYILRHADTRSRQKDYYCLLKKDWCGIFIPGISIMDPKQEVTLLDYRYCEIFEIVVIERNEN